MRKRKRRICSVGLLWALLSAAPLCAAEAWRVRFSPKGRESLTINDLKFASSTHGVAVGCLGGGRGCRPVSVLTTDGGRTWSIVETKETGLSLFFVNETNGWMVTGGGLWRTSDAGRQWDKLPPANTPVGVLQVHFLDEQRGWAVGRRKALHETSDGGVSWSQVAAAAEVAGNPEYTSYDCITFVNGRFGMIAGASLPPQTGSESGRRELPHLTIFLDTRDAGATWKASTTSMFGRVTRVQFAPDGRGLGLIEFERDFEFPSEVFSIDWKTGKSSRSFRRADCAVTDIAFGPSGQALLAAIELPGRGRSRTARGRLKFFQSADLVHWNEMRVEGRWLARRAVLATAASGLAWSATDTGAILRLRTE